MQYHRKLLKPYIYINIYLTNCTQNFTKQQLLLAALPKKNKTFCSTVGGWYKELKLKDFRVFGFIELLFNGMLQNNTFKKRILQITKLKYTCLKCLCRSNVFEYYRKICKRKQPFTVAINKNRDLTQHTFSKDEKANLLIKFISKQN